MGELINIGTKRIQTFQYENKPIYTLTNDDGIKIGIQTKYYALPDYSFHIIQDPSKLLIRNSIENSNREYQTYLKKLTNQTGYMGKMLSEREKLEHVLNRYFTILNSLTIPNSSSLSMENFNGVTSMFVLIKNQRLQDDTLKFSIDNLEIRRTGEIRNRRHCEYEGNFRMPKSIHDFLEGKIITGKDTINKFKNIYNIQN